MHLPCYKITAKGTVSILISAHLPFLLQFGSVEAGSCTSGHNHPHGTLTDPLSLTPVPKAPRKALPPPLSWRGAGCFLLSHSVVSYRARKSEVGNGYNFNISTSVFFLISWREDGGPSSVLASSPFPVILKFEPFLFLSIFNRQRIWPMRKANSWCIPLSNIHSSWTTSLSGLISSVQRR